ncbi:rhodanese-like domain-containing protein [Yeosuana marina]|uniref:rhodanese-like domain-containing protein n=1 Tax=Yeosuana marina TaxID=1565536 RepID=UPI0030C807CB|tara:strand:+ start:1727 stop:2389 length:663 start_codon:yes stop_codon:yes gene_type:complete
MVKKTVAKFLSFRYKLLALILVVLAGGLLVLPKYQKQKGIKSEQLLSNAISPERYISTDQLADKIINQDPSFILIDVRDEDSYNNYSLPNALNIPLQNLLDQDFEGYLNQNQFDVIFYSNDNFYADQAWILCDRLGYKNLRVLNGGINKWFTTIINPTEPTETMSTEEHKLYSTRKAASMFFGVMYPDQMMAEDSNLNIPVPKKVITVKKKKKRAAEGGC